jgi:hypothetical protein
VLAQRGCESIGRSQSQSVVSAADRLAGGLSRAALRGRAEILCDRINSAAPIEIRDFAGGQAERFQSIGWAAAITKEAGAGLTSDALRVLPLDGIDVIGGRNVSHWGALHRDTGLQRRSTYAPDRRGY